ncbi:hypothetical protein [Streptomyces sp. NBC_00233]|uniref:hypothetical protein n=1 Tax=Streptomyces sp. NBC_00233 TaxID=2975686 RepID=UPI002254538E|nr:hypothetical protein [Streptomyces sp. NBC_00233]MCX5229727.1 hypothetical protein [Streptomyces sp. NBC_00233]
MSINLTRPEPVIPVSPIAPLSPRDAMMRALAVAETVVAQLADRPATISIADNYSAKYGIELYFHRRPDRVAVFAAHFAVELSAATHVTDEAKTYTSATVVVDGVEVRAWALTDAAAVAA